MKNQANELNQEHNNLNDNKQEPLSKTRLKKHMQELQELGVLLTKLKPEKLKHFELPEKLYDAIKSIQTIKSHGALSRQHQYIGKLMRNLDEQTIKLIREHLIQKESH